MSTTTDRISLDDFITEHGITAEVVPGAPDGAYIPEWSGDRNDWTVALRLPGNRTMVVPFGVALAEPTERDVLECLAMDAFTVENARDYWDWAEEYGMEPSRENHNSYQATVEQTENLRSWLGHDAFEQLVWNVDAD